MRKIVLLILIINVTSIMAVHYKFYYDSAGNRIERFMHDLNGKEAIPIEEIAKQKVHVYPNPTTDFININILDYDLEKTIELEVINLSGDIIYQNILDSEYTKLDLSIFTAGSYFIRLSSYDEEIFYSIILEK